MEDTQQNSSLPNDSKHILPATTSHVGNISVDGGIGLDDFDTAKGSEKDFGFEKESNKSLTSSKYLEKSLMATSDHVFLTWHDINFDVPFIQ